MVSWETKRDGYKMTASFVTVSLLKRFLLPKTVILMKMSVKKHQLKCAGS